jgi:hypothetical protein
MRNKQINNSAQFFCQTGLSTGSKVSTGLLNIVVEWLTFLTRICEVPGSNRGPETGYPALRFTWSSLVLPGEYRYSILN